MNKELLPAQPSSSRQVIVNIIDLSMSWNAWLPPPLPSPSLQSIHVSKRCSPSIVGEKRQRETQKMRLFILEGGGSLSLRSPRVCIDCRCPASPVGTVASSSTRQLLNRLNLISLLEKKKKSWKLPSTREAALLPVALCGRHLSL